MNIYLQFPSGWWAVVLIIYGLYLFLFLQRKSYKKSKELTNQLVVATITPILSFIIEVIAINLSLWTYPPGNWPIILWVSYFGSGLLAYQLVKTIEER